MHDISALMRINMSLLSKDVEVGNEPNEAPGGLYELETESTTDVILESVFYVSKSWWMKNLSPRNTNRQRCASWFASFRGLPASSAPRWTVRPYIMWGETTILRELCWHYFFSIFNIRGIRGNNANLLRFS